MNLKRNMHLLFEQQDQTIFNMQAVMANQWLSGDRSLKLADASDVAGLWLQETGIDCSVEQVVNIMALYPKAVIALNAWGLSDTEVKSQVLSAFAHLLTGSDWPTFGDAVDVDQYQRLLKQQAILLNFVVKDGQ